MLFGVLNGVFQEQSGFSESLKKAWKNTHELFKWVHAPAAAGAALCYWGGGEIPFEVNLAFSLSLSSLSNPEQQTDLPLVYRAQHFRISWSAASHLDSR